ncbi:MAG: 23S rRNA (pseudouridine(1915)-N(3))-methyltransferase RlmH [bacterium]|nr:23S rRNA (pseudouridine(1915)-N(3))-methyltransferase RlmH [bacterium]
MKNITLLCIGHIKSSWLREGCEEYGLRLAHDIGLDIVELPASKEKDPSRQREEECGRLVDALEKRKGVIYVLDERGKQRTSVDFASLISDAQDLGEQIIFVLGGAFGLNDAVRSKGSQMSLSDMTLPHELCRLLFLEQLYRAQQIQKASGYHHA